MDIIDFFWGDGSYTKLETSFSHEEELDELIRMLFKSPEELRFDINNLRVNGEKCSTSLELYGYLKIIKQTIIGSDIIKRSKEILPYCFFLNEQKESYLN